MTTTPHAAAPATEPIQLDALPLDLAEYRAAVSASFVPLRVTTEMGPEFRGSVTQASVGEVTFTDVRAGAHLVERTPELIAAASRHFFKISLQLEGDSWLEQGGRRDELHPGDLAIYDTATPYRLGFESPTRVMVVQLPHEKFDIPRDLVRQMTAVRLDGNEGLGRVVSPFLATLGANIEQLQGPAGIRLAQNAIDLLQTLFAHQLDVARLAADPHRARIQRIRDYIDEHLDDPTLSPSTIAAANFISTRHLHALFQEQGSTVSTYVRSRRLERCYLSLTSPGDRDASIAAVGQRWGFADAAHFSRVFKAAYGESPKVVRARAFSGR
ncbi:AraC family transcriptional regulator [Pseudoclavibacter endophyticus]|uniref:Helix-turn-helix domain-containing protein n=1 Tax=Pseudoclavibacter endophyticus TaxID=1778590 RepID=A0A6H9WNP4_9MICO|nr:helix-turn-helix domain-containing protein [Pseudoclavibacter endophyticus]KAB1648398.1 helix-turn-helix domain-containing protein [Pseudoclavibacter endophyticus]GGA72364.1 AraC family transcriptional regulator [Pseudoclavibacter endophyticus]